MNTNSLEAHATLNKEPQLSDLIAAFKSLGAVGSHMQAVGKSVGMPHQTSSGRGAELKGVTPGEEIILVRKGTRTKTESGSYADDLIHVDFATPEQIASHVAWVANERQKRIHDYEKHIEKLKTSPVLLGGQA